MATFRRWMAVPMALTALALVWLLWRQTGMTGLIAACVAGVIALGLFWLAGRNQRAGRSGWVVLALVPLLAAPLAFILASAPRPAVSPYEQSGAAPWDRLSIDAARREGRPVFVFFTADWCVTCKVNEKTAIERETTAAAFRRANVAVFYGDWTHGDPAVTRALAEHGRNSVPLYLWYGPDAKDPEILPQILTPAMLAERAAAR
jgi:thiol:disulfide interchange protein